MCIETTWTSTSEQVHASWESSEVGYNAESQLVFMCVRSRLKPLITVSLSQRKLLPLCDGAFSWNDVFTTWSLPLQMKWFKSGQILLASGLWILVLEILKQDESKGKLWGLPGPHLLDNSQFARFSIQILQHPCVNTHLNVNTENSRYILKCAL